jgi:DNA-binding PadR family transcriptional regulator
MGDHLGEFELLVLLALLHLGEAAYGVAIHQDILNRARRDCSFGAVYSTLNRMQEKGLVSSRLGEATPERGGRRKRFFALTAAGKRALTRSLRAVQGMMQGLDPEWEIQ